MSEAHRVLSDPVLRAEYDRTIACGRGGAPSATAPGPARSRWDDRTDPAGTNRDMEASIAEHQAVAARYDDRSDRTGQHRSAARHLCREYQALLDDNWSLAT